MTDTNKCNEHPASFIKWCPDCMNELKFWIGKTFDVVAYTSEENRIA